MKRINHLALAIAMGAFATVASASPIVTATVSPVAGGFEYAYSITVDDPLAFVSDVYLVADGVVSGSVSSPDGWLFGGDSGGVLSWFASDAGFYGSSTHPLGRFLFHSSMPPDISVIYLGLHDFDSTGSDFYEVSVMPEAPVAVPEPATGVLLSSGLIAAITRRRRHRLTRRCTVRHSAP
jgi:hypothetical protein